MSHKVHVAVLGATGLVGRTFLQILEERHFPVGELRLLASGRSEGKTLPFARDRTPRPSRCRTTRFRAWTWR